jgi:acetylornithine deacetylase
MGTLGADAIQLLKQLIGIPSFSKEEAGTADLIFHFLQEKGSSPQRQGNNVWAYANPYVPELPTIWLNSHHDTVRPNAGYTLDPFIPLEKDGKLFGLGSNDAGGCLVALLGAFTHFMGKKLPFNLLLIASAEEEISGQHGIASLLSILPEAELALVGEPTQMALAVAEKGLLVIDGIVYGTAGHAAREEGVNAIYLALEDIAAVKNFQFAKISPFLGKTKVSCTVIHAGDQHNLVPDRCHYVLDVRVTDAYMHEEVLKELRAVLKAELQPRSLRLRSSFLPTDHPLLAVAKNLNLATFGSPTLSDQALIPYPSVKIGPGDSARSHTANEYIFLQEIEEGIQGYITLLEHYAASKR